MIGLAEAQTIQGAAAAASKVTYSVTGSLVASEKGAYSVLAQGQLPKEPGVLYEVPSGKSALVSHLLLSNTSEETQAVKLFVNGVTAAHQVASFTLPAGGFATFDRDGWKVYDASGDLLLSGKEGPAGKEGKEGPEGKTGKEGEKGKEGKEGPGPVNWRGEWKVGTEYKRNDGVSWQGSSYIYINETPSTGHEPPNATYWGILAEKGEGGGGVKQYSSYNAAEVLATGESKETGALQAGEEDKVTFTAPSGGAYYSVSASVVAKNSGSGFGGAILKVDGTAIEAGPSTAEKNRGSNGTGSFEVLGFSPTISGSSQTVGWRRVVAGESSKPELGFSEVLMIFLPKGEHTVGLYLFNEDRVGGRIKERRLVVVGL